jgi:replication-associated recombination protein RarA
MPANVVKTPADEKAWEKAKAAVRKQYPGIQEGDDRFYALTMTIFKSMRGKAVKKSLAEEIGGCGVFFVVPLRIPA